jgi:hypothetical protein
MGFRAYRCREAWEYAGDCVRPALHESRDQRGGLVVRAYEADVLREMDQKRLGMARIIAGPRHPQNVYQCPDLADEDLPVLDVIVG